MGVVDRPPLSSLGKDLSCLGDRRICAGQSPINVRKTFRRPAVPSWVPEQPTVRHKLPGRQASLGLALPAPLVRHPNQETTKQTFTNLPPPKSSTPTLSYDFTVKLLALQTSLGVLTSHTEATHLLLSL